MEKRWRERKEEGGEEEGRELESKEERERGRGSC